MSYEKQKQCRFLIGYQAGDSPTYSVLDALILHGDKSELFNKDTYLNCPWLMQVSTSGAFTVAKLSAVVYWPHSWC